MGETVVVVGYDGHPRSDRVLKRAIETVKADGGKLVVVEIAEELPPASSRVSHAGLGPSQTPASGAWRRRFRFPRTSTSRFPACRISWTGQGNAGEAGVPPSARGAWATRRR